MSPLSAARRLIQDGGGFPSFTEMDRRHCCGCDRGLQGAAAAAAAAHTSCDSGAPQIIAAAVRCAGPGRPPRPLRRGVR